MACGSTNTRTATTSPIPRRLLAEARPIGTGPRFQPRATGPVIEPCRTALGPRVGAHIEVFGADRVVILPAGIGTRAPRRTAAGRIAAARCYGELVTLDPTGVVLIRPAARLYLSDLFRAWGVTLSSRRLASFSATAEQRVVVFVDGRRSPGSPGAVPLTKHAEIVIEVGPYVPPHASFTFPPGI